MVDSIPGQQINKGSGLKQEWSEYSPTDLDFVYHALQLVKITSKVICRSPGNLEVYVQKAGAAWCIPIGVTNLYCYDCRYGDNRD